MRFLLFLLVAAAFAPTATAQKPVEAWYRLSSGNQVEMVQATTIQMSHFKNLTEVMADGRQIDFGAAVTLAFAGTGPEPMAQNGRSGSTGASGDGQHTEVEVVVDLDGNVSTRTTTTTTDLNTGGQTTTTTTTTTTSEGDTTTTTTTTKE